MLAARSTRALKKNIELAEELEYQNIHLESLVTSRTKEIEIKNEKITDSISMQSKSRRQFFLSTQQ